MGQFIHDDFLLQSKQARELYHEFARDLPVIDYHSHLDPALIASDHHFNDLWEIWLKGDHYKWRAMRTNGVNEDFITGEASPRQKFQLWAETVPYTLRNPLYHWTHLELVRYFGYTDLLDGSNAQEVWDLALDSLQDPAFSVTNLLRRMKVEVVCTTDDPIDDLTFHQQIREADTDIQVRPTFRPDKACTINDSYSYNAYLDQLGSKAGLDIATFEDLIRALAVRHDYFHNNGCRLADHGLSNFLPSPPPDNRMEEGFKQLRKGKPVDAQILAAIQNGILLEVAKMNHNKGWVQQFHYGAIRNNNTAMFNRIGPDTGFDSIGDFPVAGAMSRFFDQLAQENSLSKTILYNLNPAHNHVVATMIGNFQDGSSPGKMQFGSGWWFLDQKQGMEEQLNVLSNLGLLSRFVGMLTDSRSFLSYPRHEYFRRVLCNLLGHDMQQGLIPDDLPLIGKMVTGICYENAREYFGFTAE